MKNILKLRFSCEIRSKPFCKTRVLLPMFIATSRLAHQTFAKSFRPCLHRIKGCFLTSYKGHRQNEGQGWPTWYKSNATLSYPIGIIDPEQYPWYTFLGGQCQANLKHLNILKELMPLMPATAMLSPIGSFFGGTFGPTAWMIPKQTHKLRRQKTVSLRKPKVKTLIWLLHR